jgi:hypothetical protein
MSRKTWLWEQQLEALDRPACAVLEVHAIPQRSGELWVVMNGFGYMLDTPNPLAERVYLFWFDTVVQTDTDLEEVFRKRDLGWKIITRRSARIPQLARINRQAHDRYLRMTGYVVEDQGGVKVLLRLS